MNLVAPVRLSVCLFICLLACTLQSAKDAWLHFAKCEMSNSCSMPIFDPIPCTLIKKLWNPLLLQSHRTFVYLQRNTVNNKKVSFRADMASCGPFVLPKGIIGVLVYCLSDSVNVIIDRDAWVILYLVASVRLSVRPSVRPSVCPSVCVLSHGWIRTIISLRCLSVLSIISGRRRIIARMRSIGF